MGISNQRYSIVFILLATIMAHVIEIWCFAVAYYGLMLFDGTGSIAGFSENMNMLDYVYFPLLATQPWALVKWCRQAWCAFYLERHWKK